jgi:lysozyme
MVAVLWFFLAVALVGCAGRGEGTALEASALEQCAAQSVEGIDVFDGQGAVDWAAVRDAGIVFALIKATQGTYDTQSTFAFNWQAAKEAGVRRSAYHFFDPTEDGAEQARRLLSVVGDDRGELPVTLDAECPDGDPGCLGVPGRSIDASLGDVFASVASFLHTITQATGRRPIVYTFASYFASLGVDAGALAAYPLDIAYPATGTCFLVPMPWSRAAFWQYSWTGSIGGIDVPVDRERFLGDLTALDALGAVGGDAAVTDASGDGEAPVASCGSAGPGR